MKAGLAILLTLCLGLTSCGGDSHTKVANEMASWMNDMATTLEAVKDKASAEANKSKLEALAKTGQDLKKRRETLGEPSAELKKTLESIMKEPSQKMMAAMMKLMGNAEVQKALGDALKDVMKK